VFFISNVDLLNHLIFLNMEIFLLW